MPFGQLTAAHRWLTTHGFERDLKVTRYYAYDGVFQCANIEVPIRLEFVNLNFQKLPEVFLRSPRPDLLDRPLPHVDHRGKVCYLDEEAYRVDPYQPVQTLVNLLDQARKVLIDSLSGKNSAEVGYEFGPYWNADHKAVLVSTVQSGRASPWNWVKYKNLKGEEVQRIVVGSKEALEKYRNDCQGEFANRKHTNAYCIQLDSIALLPQSGDWPPRNFSQFYHWLASVSEKAAKSLYRWLGTNAGACNPLLILLKTRSGTVGAELTLPRALKSSLENPARFRKQLLVDKGKVGTRFLRCVVYDITPKLQTTRNLLGKDLSGKRIVLMGCGTIGGYLAHLLVQIGAGREGGELRLYDGQDLSPGNIGRHYLDSRYLFENKAEACQHKLQQEYSFATVRAKPADFSDIGAVQKFDLLIDATGREAFSMALNEKILRQRAGKSPCPEVVYVWIDANGLCARVMFEDGAGGCYRCQQDLSGKDRYPAYKKETDLVPMRYQCGESYVPYPPSISVQAAALGLEMLLDWADGKTSPSFRQRRFSSKARSHKDQNLSPVKGCPACQR